MQAGPSLSGGRVAKRSAKVFINTTIKNFVSPVVNPAKVNFESGKEFIEGIREGLEDFAEGRCKVFKDADELLACLLKP